jgi:6-phosphogluconolactonase
MKRPTECANSRLKVLMLCLATCAAGACSGGGGGGKGGSGAGAMAMLQVKIGLLSVVPSHFVSGQTGSIAVTVENNGGLATSSTTTVTATLSTGLTYVSGTGAGWSCAASSGTNISCSNSAAIAGNSKSLLTVSVAIGASASSGLIAFYVTNPQGLAAITQLPMNFTVLYTVGGSVAGLTAKGLVLTDNGGDKLAVGASGPFTFATALQTGKVYAAAVATQPAPQSCQLQNASGTISAANITSISVSCVTPSGHYAFVGNKFASTVSVYLIGTDGTLSQINASPFPAKGVSALAINPAGTLLYATNSGPDTVTGFSVAGGTLTALAQGPVGVGTNPASASTDPTGTFLYIGNLNSNNVSGFTINSSTGALTAISGSPFSVPSAASWVTVDPNPLDKFVYVTGLLPDSAISTFSFDPMTGVLTAVGTPFTSGLSNPAVIAFNSAGTFAYTANYGSGTVSAFSVNGTTGTLTQLAGSPYTAGGGASGVALDPSGSYLYVSNQIDGTVSAFSIDAATGELTSLGPAVAAGTGPAQIVVDPTGKFVYVPNSGGSNNVSGYSIGAGGELTPLPGSPFPAGSGSNSIVVY